MLRVSGRGLTIFNICAADVPVLGPSTSHTLPATQELIQVAGLPGFDEIIYLGFQASEFATMPRPGTARTAQLFTLYRFLGCQ